MIEKIKTIKLPPGEYEINGKIQMVEHTFIINLDNQSYSSLSTYKPPYYNIGVDICCKAHIGTCKEGLVIASCRDKEHAEYIVNMVNENEKHI